MTWKAIALFLASPATLCFLSTSCLQGRCPPLCPPAILFFLGSQLTNVRQHKVTTFKFSGVAYFVPATRKLTKTTGEFIADFLGSGAWLDVGHWGIPWKSILLSPAPLSFLGTMGCTALTYYALFTMPYLPCSPLTTDRTC